jgi:hypothetical protein
MDTTHNSYYPVCLFTYNRLSETKKTIEALQQNFLSFETDIFIFSDAAKNMSTNNSVDEVRAYLKSITGFKSITLIKRETNFGLAKSIIEGVSQVLNKFDAVIVLEDDLITSKNFLNYMNSALSFYSDNDKIWSVSGFSFPINYPKSYQYDAAFGVRASSWGWATWKNRWDKVDWAVSDFNYFKKDKIAQKAFNQGGSDMCKMLDDQMSGKINSWAIRFCYAQFKHNAVDVYPTLSKVLNEGFNGDATHIQDMDKRFDTVLDNSEQVDFTFSKKISIDNYLFIKLRKPFAIAVRLKYKLLGLIQ